MTKFRIAFTISAETMFSMMSKLLPIDDLTVEELGIGHSPIPKLAMHARHVAQVRRALAKPERKRRSKGVDLEHGINAIIVDHLSDGKPHRAQEMMPLMKTEGFSPNSVASRLESLKQAGIVYRVGDGTWKLTQKEKTSAA